MGRSWEEDWVDVNSIENTNNKMQYSVLMAVYIKDNFKWFDDAVKSILNQTVKPEQVVIVQDGMVSKQIINIIDRYKKGNKELFTIVVLEHNAGLATALNEGLKHCRNDLVARMDADDISLPMRCEMELEVFKKYQDLSICGCNIGEFQKNPTDIKTFRLVPEDYVDILNFSRKRQAFNHPTIIYRKSEVLKCGGYKSLLRKEDFDLFSRMLAAGCYARNINEVLYLYRANENNYLRRKSICNLKCAINVYWLHYKRKSCTAIDFIIICFAEVIFFIMPVNVMKKISNCFLRTQKQQTTNKDNKNSCP